MAADGQVCDYRPTSKPHRYYIPIPLLTVSILRCQPAISEMTNSEEDVGVSYFPDWSTFHLDIRTSWRGGGGWMAVREKETTSRHYFYDISSLSSLTMVHFTPGCTNSSCIKRLSDRWAWRQIELRITECIIAHQVWYYQSPMRNLQGKELECNYYLHHATECEWAWHHYWHFCLRLAIL